MGCPFIGTRLNGQNGGRERPVHRRVVERRGEWPTASELCGEGAAVGHAWAVN
jgi:hypothetical protein